MIPISSGVRLFGEMCNSVITPKIYGGISPRGFVDLNPPAFQPQVRDYADHYTNGDNLIPQNITASLFASSNSTNFTPRLLESGNRIPIGQNFALCTMNAVGKADTIQSFVPVSRMSFTGASSELNQACGIVVTTKEAVRVFSPTVSAMLGSSALKTVLTAVDRAVRDILITSSTPTFTVAGSTPPDILGGFENIFNSACKGSGSYLIIASPSACNFLSTQPLQALVGLGPSGGEAFGIPVVVSDLIDDGTLVLVDANRCCGDVRELRLDIAEATSLRMTDDPSGPAELVSLFQTDSVALKATTVFSFSVLDESAVAVLGGLDGSSR